MWKDLALLALPRAINPSTSTSFITEKLVNLLTQTLRDPQQSRISILAPCLLGDAMLGTSWF